MSRPGPALTLQDFKQDGKRAKPVTLRPLNSRDLVAHEGWDLSRPSS
jgi:hypothetical protein